MFFLILDIAVESGVLGIASFISWTVAVLAYLAVRFVTAAAGDD